VATELPGTSRWPFCARMGHPGIADLVLFVASRPEGQRNNSLYWAARRAIECGHEDGLGALVFAAAKAGLPEDEAWRTVRSAQRQVAT